MKKILFIILAMVLVLSVFAVQVPKRATAYTPPYWHLYWSDEFNDYSIDSSKWNVEDINWGPEYIRPQNVSEFGTTLRLTAKYESYEGRDYTSGRVNTKNKMEINGNSLGTKIEIRAFLPSDEISGTVWPALWMKPASLGDTTWPWDDPNLYDGEIDIMEQFYDWAGYYWMASIHSNHVDAQPIHSSSTTCAADTTGYHVWTLEWYPAGLIPDHGELKWYFDGVLCKDATSWTHPDIHPEHPFSHSFFLLIGLGVGTPGSNPPWSHDSLPAHMYIDYVRVYIGSLYP